MPTCNDPIPGYDAEDPNEVPTTIPASPLPLSSISAPRLEPSRLAPPPIDLLMLHHLLGEDIIPLICKKDGSGS